MGKQPQPRIHEITRVEVEHGLGQATNRGFVKLRVIGDTAVMMDHLEPAAARSIAQDLLNAAARAEYEQDLYDELSTTAGMPQELIGMVIFAVRQGEARRETDG